MSNPKKKIARDVGVRRQPWSFIAKVTIGNAAALFGWFVALAVLWQCFMGTIQVGPVMGAVLVALLAMIITVIVEMRTKQALVKALLIPQAGSVRSLTPWH